MQASPAKLPDDTWGVRVYDPAYADQWTGQPVTVEAKSGKSWTSVLVELVSYNEAKGVALYRPAAKGAKPAAAPTCDRCGKPAAYALTPDPQGTGCEWCAPCAQAVAEERKANKIDALDAAPAPIAGGSQAMDDAPTAQVVPADPTIDPMITTLANLLITAQDANPEVSIPDLAFAATKLAMATKGE